MLTEHQNLSLCPHATHQQSAADATIAKITTDVAYKTLQEAPQGAGGSISTGTLCQVGTESSTRIQSALCQPTTEHRQAARHLRSSCHEIRSTHSLRLQQELPFDVAAVILGHGVRQAIQRRASKDAQSQSRRRESSHLLERLEHHDARL